jgi:hypothetical protein
MLILLSQNEQGIIYYAIHNTFAQNLSKIDAMINPLVVESFTLHEEEIYYRYNFVPNNFKECDLDVEHCLSFCPFSFVCPSIYDSSIWAQSKPHLRRIQRI